MRKKICTVIEYLNGYLVLAGVTAMVSLILAAILNYDFTQQFLVLYAIAAGIYTVILVAERFARGLPLFLLIVLGSFALTLLIPMPVFTRFVTCFFTAILINVAIVARVKEVVNPLRKPAIIIVVFFAILYIAGMLTDGVDTSVMLKITYGLTFGYAILIAVYKNFKNLQKYLDTNQYVQNIPTSQIDRTNTGSLVIYVVLMAALMIGLPLTKAGNIFTLLWKGVKALLGLIFRNAGGHKPSDSGEPMKDPQGADMGSLDLGEAKPTPQWLKDFYEIMMYVVFAFLGLLILIGIIILIVKLFKNFYKPYSENDDVQEFIQSKEEEKSSILPRFKDVFKRPDWLDFSPNAVVRRAYKKTILKGSSDAPSQAMTPTELEAFAGLPEGEDTELLHTLYEKARYTSDGVTKDEAKLLKSRA